MLNLLVLTSRINLEYEESEKLQNIIKQPIDWAMILKISQNLRSQPLLYKHLSQKQYKIYIPEQVFKILEKSYLHQSFQNLRIQGQIIQIIKAMNEADIPVILLKGSFLLNKIYQDIALRPMSDIDILCQSSDIDRICEKMIALGYSQTNFLQSSIHNKLANHLPPFQKTSGIPVEIHYDIFYKIKKDYKIMQNIWQFAAKIELYGFPVFSLSLEDMLLHLSCHLYKHMNGTGYTPLYWFCDIHEIIKQNINIIDWNKFYQKVKDLDLEPEIGSIFYFMKDVWKTNMSDVILNELTIGKDRFKLENIIFKKQDFLINYLMLFKRAYSLPGIIDPICYLFRSFFPARVHLINRYKVKDTMILWLLLLIINPFLVIGRFFKRICLNKFIRY